MRALQVEKMLVLPFIVSFFITEIESGLERD